MLEAFPPRTEAEATADVRVYIKPDCASCAITAKVVTEWAALNKRVALLIDVNSRRELLESYGFKVPVIAVGDRIVGQFDTDLDTLKSKLFAQWTNP
ncbi:MAG: glutaredoxin family protein [Gammaproteobacteria bacterium]|nr:glutaredoxin family protein [Gammaproteobacteria bacterium]